MKELEFTITRKLDEDVVKDILTTAIEGGIGYWAILDNDTEDWKKANEACKERMKSTPCYCDTAYELLSTGKEVIFIDAESEDYDHPKDDEVWSLTWDKFVKGCSLYEENRNSIKKCLKDGDFDAIEADCLIQYALFNEVIYG